MEYNFSFDFSNFEFETDQFQTYIKANNVYYNFIKNHNLAIEFLFLLEIMYQKNEYFLGFEIRLETRYRNKYSDEPVREIYLDKKYSKKLTRIEIDQIPCVSGNLFDIKYLFDLEDKNDNEIKELKKKYFINMFSDLKKREDRFAIYEKIIRKFANNFFRPYLFDYIKLIKNEKNNIEDLTFEINGNKIKLIDDNYKHYKHNKLKSKLSSEFVAISSEMSDIAQKLHFLFMTKIFNENPNISHIFYNPDLFFQFYLYDYKNKTLIKNTFVNKKDYFLEESFNQELIYQFEKHQEPNENHFSDAIRKHYNNNNLYLGYCFKKGNNYTEYTRGGTDLDSFILNLTTYNEMKILNKSFNTIVARPNPKHRL